MDEKNKQSNLARGLSGRTLRRELKIARVLAQRQEDLTLILANIHDPHNVSAIFRSCDAFGVDRVHLYYTREAFPELGLKTSASARKWVESKKHSDCKSMFEELKTQGFKILATSFGPVATPLLSWSFLQPTAIILGNEHDGVEPELLQMADGELYIPMHGMIQSLNVSVAAAVILAEAAKQRELAGWYETRRMNDEDYNARLKKWLKK